MAYRVLRICSETVTRDKRMEELKELFISRQYNVNVTDLAIARAKLVPREQALLRVKKKATSRVIFALDYHPALPLVSRIMNKAWCVMVQDPYLQDVFPQPPMVAYRRPPSLRSVLVKAKVPPLPIRQSNRTHNGMKRCSKCVVCPYVTEQRIVKSSQNCFVHNINKPVNCDSSNVVYLVECKKCKEQYVGQTGRAFKERMKEHIGYIKGKKLTEPTGLHFNLPGHNLSMFQASIIEKCNHDSRAFRERREEEFIKHFQTKFKGMNRKL